MSRLPVLLLAALLWSGSSSADEPSRPIDPLEFITAYRPALKTLEERFANFTCRAAHKRPTYDAIVEYAVDGAHFLSAQHYSTDVKARPAGYPQVHVRSESPDGTYELSKENEAAAFFISGIGPSNDEVLRRYHRRYNKPVSLAATHVFDVSMNTLINSKDAKLLRASASTRQNRDTVTVEFALDHTIFRFHRALVTFEPSRTYRVVAYKLFYSADPSDGKQNVAVYSGDVEYEKYPFGEFDVPSKVEIRVDEGQRRTVIEFATVDNFEFNSVKEDRFPASAFGIPNATHAYPYVAGKFDLSPSRISVTVAAGQEMDAQIPVPKEATAYRIIGAENALVCSRTGCGQFINLPMAVPASTSSNVTYRFKAQSPGTETIKLTLISNSSGGRRIPIEIQVTVTEPGAG
ncbi:MAG: hypothetical protein ACK5A1_08860 [Planctomyces sp.]|jgi:hypothetical protein